jgi:hypothetical protein
MNPSNSALRAWNIHGILVISTGSVLDDAISFVESWASLSYIFTYSFEIVNSLYMSASPNILLQTATRLLTNYSQSSKGLIIQRHKRILPLNHIQAQLPSRTSPPVISRRFSPLSSSSTVSISSAAPHKWTRPSPQIICFVSTTTSWRTPGVQRPSKLLEGWPAQGCSGLLLRFFSKPHLTLYLTCLTT